MSTGYTRSSIERALTIHKDAHRIVEWGRDPSELKGYVVLLNSGEWLNLNSYREAWILVNGLASAAHASEKRDQDWADQLAAANAETKED